MENECKPYQTLTQTALPRLPFLIIAQKHPTILYVNQHSLQASSLSPSMNIYLFDTVPGAFWVKAFVNVGDRLNESVFVSKQKSSD